MLAKSMDSKIISGGLAGIKSLGRRFILDETDGPSPIILESSGPIHLGNPKVRLEYGKN